MYHSGGLSMKAELSMSVAKYGYFLNSLNQYGINKPDILALADVNPLIVASPNNRLTANQLNRITIEAVRLTYNENIGLLPEEVFFKGFSNILGHLLMNCHTLGEAIEKYCNYESIIDDSVISSLQLKGATAIFNVATIDNGLVDNRQYSDMNISGTFAYIKSLTNQMIAWKEVHFTYPQPQDMTIYQKVFNCPVIFNSPKNALIFETQQLDLPLHEPNQDLLLFFEQKAQAILDSFRSNAPITKMVKNIIFQVMNEHIPVIDEVAEILDMGVRNLQIYLKTEGTSYIQLLNEIRMNQALNYLKDHNISIANIANKLGFSDSSAFHKAFKKWTDHTPGEMRARRLI